MVLIPHSTSTTPSLGFLLLLLAFVALNTSALDCNFQPYNTSASLMRTTVSSQEDINTIFEGCTTINGTIYIAANYTGSFYLPSVTSISEGIATKYDENATLLTSMEAPDLTSIARIHIVNAPSLTTVSFPILSTTSGINLEGIGSSVVNFPSLSAVSGDLTVTGTVSSLNFPILTGVNGALFVASNTVLAKYSIYNPGVDLSDYPPLDISFPELQNASSVRFRGNISSLSVPRVSTIPHDDGLRISTYGNPLNISLPSLSNISRLSLVGTISSTSFPSLLSVLRFTLTSTDPLDVDLGPLEGVGTVRLEGNITGVSMPALTSIGEIQIYTKLPMDCTNAADAWKRANRTVGERGYHCNGTIRKDVIHKKVVLGVKIGVPIFVVACICVCAYFWRRRLAKRKKSKDTPPQYELDSAPPKYAADSPPIYVADSSSDQGSETAAAAAGAHPVGGSSRAAPHDEGPAGRNVVV